ncbi:MAG: DUF4328 domain-containing protein [Paludibaculum sp.]
MFAVGSGLRLGTAHVGGFMAHVSLGAVDRLALVLGASALVAVSAWVRAAGADLRALGVSGERLTPAASTAAVVVPGVNVVGLKVVLDDVARASGPRTPLLSSSWRHQAAPVWSHVAWIAAGVAVVLWAAGTPADLDLLGAAGAAAAVAAGGLLVVVTEAQLDQQERAALFGPDIARARSADGDAPADEPVPTGFDGLPAELLHGAADLGLPPAHLHVQRRGRLRSEVGASPFGRY